MTTSYMPTAAQNWILQLAERTGTTADRLIATWDDTDETAGHMRRYQQLEAWTARDGSNRDLMPDWRLARAVLRHRQGGVGDPGRTVRLTQIHTMGELVPAHIAREGHAYREAFDGAGLTLWPERTPLLRNHNRNAEIGEVTAVVVEGSDTAVIADVHPTGEGDQLLADIHFGDRPVGVSWGFVEHSTQGKWTSERSEVLRQRACITEVSIVREGVRATYRTELLSPAGATLARSRSISRSASHWTGSAGVPGLIPPHDQPAPTPVTAYTRQSSDGEQLMTRVYSGGRGWAVQ